MPSPPPSASSPALRPLLAVYGALLLLLLLTIGAGRLPLGPWATPVALTIASTKALLVAIWFMQLRRAGALLRLFALGGLGWLAIAVVLTMADYLTRH